MPRAKKLNILLVDDQPAKLLTYEVILSGLDMNLVKANSGEEALQHLLKTDFAVILVDVVMPNIDGFELAQLIRGHPRCEKTAIIFISGVQITKLDQLRGYEFGAVDYISVPVVPELLRARVTVFAELYRKTVALEYMNRELEQRVAERTAELEMDLAERKRLELALLQADRRKDEFLAVLAHELRNPLAPIRTAVDILRMLPIVDPQILQCRDLIGGQVDQMIRLVNDLLEISRITHGSYRLEKQFVDISEVIRLAVETQESILQKRRHHFVLEMPKQPLIVECDPARLAEAVANLIGNAAKYTDENGQIALTVEQGESTQDKTEVVIRVKDNGVGIPPEMLKKVFEMFAQVNSTLKRSQGGLGIGLALVRKLAEMHGGTVDCFSEGLGKGSEFVIKLPLPLQKAMPQAESDEQLPDISSRRVLVVDDNSEAAFALAFMLRLDGATVETANDGPQALLIAERFRPEFILLDVGMPGMSGLDVARAVRRKPWGADVVLVAQTGWGQEEDRQKTSEAGFDAHLTKPLQRATLLKLMSSHSSAASIVGR